MSGRLSDIKYYKECKRCGANPGVPCNGNPVCVGPRDLYKKLPGDETVNTDGTITQVRDIPLTDRGLRQMLGVGHYNPYGRKVVQSGGPYAFTPDTCELADNRTATRWIENGTILICTGCGIDGT